MKSESKYAIMKQRIQTELTNHNLSISTINDLFHMIGFEHMKIDKISQPYKSIEQFELISTSDHYLIFNVYFSKQQTWMNELFYKKHPNESSQGYNNMIYVDTENPYVILRYTS